MELRQLKAFVKTAETLSFSQAAKELCVTQSALSQSLKKLEEELGAPLFYRDSHIVMLTDAGQALLPQAKKTLEESENCFAKLNDLVGMKRGSLNIGITHSYRIISSDTLNRFISEYPGINFHIYYKSSEELMTMLENKELDVVLSYKTSTYSNPQIESHNLFDDKLCVIVSRFHELAKKEKVTLEEVAKYPLALPTEGTQARILLNKILEKYHFRLNPRIEIDEVTPLLSLVAYGKIVTILSGHSCRTKEGTVAIPLDVEGAEMQGCFHLRKDSYLKKTAKEFLRLLCETHLLSLKMEALEKR